MSRNTHDRQLDHHGPDLASNSTLDSATTTYGSGDDLMTVIADIDDRVIAGGGGGGGSAYTDLLTGDASNFDGSITGWSATGSASIAYDGAVGLIGTSYGSLKITATTNSATKGAEAAVAGTFLAGHTYEVVLAVKGDTVGGGNYTGWVINLGDQGASDFSDGPSLRYRDVGDTTVGVWHESDKVMLIRGLWTPSSNRTSVTVKVRRDPFDDNQSDILWVLMARVVEIPEGWQPLSNTLGTMSVYGFPEFGATENSGRKGFGANLLRGGAQFSISQFGDSADLQAMDDENGDASRFTAYLHGVWTYATQSSLGRRNGNAWNVEVGPDYVGLYINERSSTEVEIVPDWEYDVVLIDGGQDSDTSHHWYIENADGTQKSALALLHNIKTGTADPTAGGGVAHPMPAIYLRNNSNVTELWLATGTGNTAWTKQNTP